jgi:hypothetical protein
VAEQRRAEPVDVQREGRRRAVEVVAQGGGQLGTAPDRALLVQRRGDQLAVAVPAYPQHPLAQAEQPLQGLHRHRAERDVAGDDDPVDAGPVDLGQHRLQRRQVSVHVREHRGSHRVILAQAKPRQLGVFATGGGCRLGT